MTLLRLILILAIGVFLLRSAGGRLAPKMVFAPLMFLVTRWPVLAAWVAGSAGMYALIASDAAANGKSPSESFLIGLSLFCGLGFAAMVVGPVWMIIRAFADKPTFELEEGEVVERTIRANHMLGNEARGGALLLTNRRIGFRPHRFNGQVDTWSVPREQLRRARPEGTRLLVLETDAGEEILVVPNPDRVAEKLQSTDQPAFV